MQITDTAVIEIKKAMPGLRALENEPMRAHCSFRIGGPARLMALPSSEGEVVQLCRLLRDMGIRPLVMGRGTNLLVADAGVDNVVVKMGEGLDTVEEEGRHDLLAGSGVSLARLAQAAQTRGLSGLEFAHGIPGSLGGAVAMNAGAYGGEMKDVVMSTVYIGEDLQVHTATGGDQQFGYRRSGFTNTPRIILHSLIRLKKGDPEAIAGRMAELMEKRKASQPLDLPSAGSTFKRPKDGFAAALIDQAGLKGYTIGGAQVSPKHAGFVVNVGGATCDDVLRLMDHIRETVLRQSGVELEPEVRIVR